jgi:CDGSH-type Zn-finger protein
MPTHATEDRFGHLRTTVQLQKGERKVALCRCFQSKDFPFCDGTHKQLPTNAGPVIVEVTLPEEKPET